MANLVKYQVLVKGTKLACETLPMLLPAAGDSLDILREEGTDTDYSMLFSNVCNWSVASGSASTRRRKPFTQEELKAIEYNCYYTLKDLSRLLDCEIFCAEVDIDDPRCWGRYHYCRGKATRVEFPQEVIPQV